MNCPCGHGPLSARRHGGRLGARWGADGLPEIIPTRPTGSTVHETREPSGSGNIFHLIWRHIPLPDLPTHPGETRHV
jgi:hypothetical protein